jgi:hypothetical protein
MADTLSRAFIGEFIPEDPEFNIMVHLLSNELPMSEERKKKFQGATRMDVVLKELMVLRSNGWPEHKRNCPPQVKR